MSKEKWLFFSVNASCLACYVAVSIFSAVSGIPVSALEMAAVIGASTIFHLAKKFYNSPLARDINEAENRLGAIASKSSAAISKQEEQAKLIADLQVGKEALEKHNQELQRSLNELQMRFEHLEDEKKKSEDQLRKTREFLEGAKKLNDGLTKQVTTLQEDNTKLRGEEVALCQRLSTTAEIIRLLDKMVADEKESLSRTAGRCDDLRKELHAEYEKDKVLEEAHAVFMLKIGQMGRRADEKSKML